MDIIASRSHGNFDAYEATVENAKTILSWQTVPQEAKDFAAKKPERYLTHEVVARIIKKIADSPVGEDIKTSRGEVFPVTDASKQEVVMWMYANKIQPDRDITSHVNENVVNQLQCLAPWHGLPIVDEYIAEYACALVTIQEDRWKVSATEKAKINYILRFVNDLCHRDEEYELITVTEKA